MYANRDVLFFTIGILCIFRTSSSRVKALFLTVVPDQCSDVVPSNVAAVAITMNVAAAVVQCSSAASQLY